MPTVECDHETVAGVTLVTCTLTSEVRQRVTVEPTHDGPVWPPRRQGVPAAGWDGDGWTGLVPADGIRALGYATPATPDGDPVCVAASERPDGDEAVSARDVIRSLGDPTPTRDAVPARSTPGTTTDAAASVDGTPDAAEANPDATPGAEADAVPGDVTGTPSPSPADEPPAPGTAPDLDAVETRLWTARDLAAATSVPEAREAVDRAGGLDSVRALADRLGADRAALRERRARIDRLLEDAEAVEVPVDALARLV